MAHLSRATHWVAEYNFYSKCGLELFPPFILHNEGEVCEPRYLAHILEIDHVMQTVMFLSHASSRLQLRKGYVLHI
jgi:hypothetical protein